MTSDPASNLVPALERLVQRSARGMVARARLAAPGLNRWLTQALAVPPGSPGALLADPVIEAARFWQPAAERIADLAPGLLAPELVAALDGAGGQAMPRDRHPHAHQLAAWQASLAEGKSVLVTAGTGAGKTECFLIPILQDILAHPRPGGGVRAILLYPLNALIESQRERLAAWAAGLGGRVRFALLNGDTPDTERQAAVKSDAIELRSREAIRARPPEILVTNITMLEYLLLRAQDRALLQASQGALRWIVLDEAHSYIGSQAAEMALLLRRVRAAFGVTPAQVRVMATSATIGGQDDALPKLRAFAATLAGQPEDRAAVIEGRERALPFPAAGADIALDADALASKAPLERGALLAAHPRLQALCSKMAADGVTLSDAARILLDDPGRRAEAARLLDQAASAVWQGRPLLPWRAHLFHRAQGGLWACPDRACPHRAPELAADGSGWAFGAAYLAARARCDCGAPVYEVTACADCGTAYLQGVLVGGAEPRLDPPVPGEGDDFALDAEPDDDVVGQAAGIGWLAEGAGVWLADDGRIFDNAPPDGVRARPLRLLERAEERGCCPGAERARLMGLRFGPAFLMGTAIGGVLEDLAPPDGAPGLPAGGRRALTFSDSRQGVARLAAKLQQDAERSLTRAFLWHAVQDEPLADPAEVDRLRAKVAAMKAAGLGDLAAEDEARLLALTGAAATPLPWPELVQRLAVHADLVNFAGEIWRARWVGRAMADDPAKLAEMFLYRELFRRPRVQNNPETMGLLRLAFPAMEERARLQGPPAPLAQSGLDAEGWAGLAQTAVDLVFRQALAVEMAPWMVPLVAPRFGRLNSVAAAAARPQDLPPNARRWPDPRSDRSRLVQLVHALCGGSPGSRIDEDRAGEVLDALWALIAGTAARDSGGGAWRLDFARAAVMRLDRAWLCPVTRRPYGYALGGRSPNDPAHRMPVVDLPRLPIANPGGLAPDQRAEIALWVETDPQVAALRDQGLWTDLHDRLAAFPPYIRAQEHSAQIARPTLQRYEQSFKEGRINLLNCSTTMEMGVDIADVRLVVNANVPPALSNYRQRSGRAGRRGEPWAFTLTFCRDLPLDRRVFDAPAAFLRRPIVAPRVWFDSPALVQRHVNAALLAAWLGERGGHNVLGSIGAFMGAGKDLADAVLPDAQADAFLADLEGAWGRAQGALLAPLVAGTVLDGRAPAMMVAQARDALERLVRRWRDEHRTLLEGTAAAPDPDARKAIELRAKRLAGEFLLGELARRGFTPAYGFPTDVVTFSNLTERPDDGDQGFSHLRRGTAARPLDQAIREYAPGAEVVIDGLVHQSEGVLPAWEAGADGSRLEDLRLLWSCPGCHAFGLEAASPGACPGCGHPGLSLRKVLRPAGFLGGKVAHVGYENLAHVVPDPVRLSAQGGDWLALPEGAGRMRADPAGQVASSAAGPLGGGFAVCLDCGRAEPMAEPRHGIAEELPDAIRRHRPLLRSRSLRLTHDGLCSSVNATHRIQRHVHLAQVTRTDIWEWQLPGQATEAAAMALAAALREALAERLGVESSEIGPACGASTGAAGEARRSVFLHDRAAGGAGLVARLAEPEMLAACLARAEQLLDCPEGCRRGCPACILRPDLNQPGLALDRAAALELARAARARLDLAPPLRVFGPATRLAGQPADLLVAGRLRSGALRGLDLWLHGDPGGWDLPGWPMRAVLARAAAAGLRPRLHLDKEALTAAGFDLSRKLALHNLAQGADLHLCDRLPRAGEACVVLRAEGAAGCEALAVTDPAEALPGAAWGAGAAAPAVIGPAPDLPCGTRISAERLMALGVGNARLMRPGAALDGPAAGFGKRFWDWLRAHAPLEIGAMQGVGLRRLAYTDRYLLQPYALRLLAEVMRTAPGAGGAERSVALAPADRLPAEPRFLHDGFPSDGIRRELLAALLPGAEVSLSPKPRLPHYRALTAELADGRRLTIHLDQGFGGWRVDGTQRHDFAAPAAAQARSLTSAVFRVTGADMLGAPLALSFD